MRPKVRIDDSAHTELGRPIAARRPRAGFPCIPITHPLRETQSVPARKTAAKKAKTRRVHTVKAQLSVTELTRAGTALTLEVHGKEGKLGELEVGRGALYWKGRYQQEAKRIGWTRFAEMMDDLASSNLRARRSSAAT